MRTKRARLATLPHRRVPACLYRFKTRVRKRERERYVNVVNVNVQVRSSAMPSGDGRAEASFASVQKRSARARLDLTGRLGQRPAGGLGQVGGDTVNAPPANTAAQLARDALGYKLSDFVFDGTMEGDFDRARPEVAHTTAALAHYRRLVFIDAPATIEGGDVLRLKSACTRIDDETILAKPQWIDLQQLGVKRVLFVSGAEPLAANVLAIGDRVIVSASVPCTRAVLERAGYKTVPVEVPNCTRPRVA